MCEILQGDFKAPWPRSPFIDDTTKESSSKESILLIANLLPFSL